MRLSACVLPGLLCLGLLPACAQLKPREAGRQDGPLQLDVVVTDKDGAPVIGLTQGDFTVKDDGATVPVTQFQAAGAGSEPAEAIIVIDAVNLNFVRLADERSRVERFLKGSEVLPVPTALAIFTDDGPQVENGFSTNGPELANVLDKFNIGLRTTRRSTQFEEQDRFNLSIKALTQLMGLEGARPGRKLIFWVSPGWPLLSGPQVNLTAKQQDGIFRDIVTFTAEMIQKRITLYTLNPLGVEEGVGRVFYYRDFLKGVKKPAQAEIGDLALQVLSTESGGLVLNSSNDLQNELKQCFADSRAGYGMLIEAKPGESANQYHRLEVSVARPGAAVRTKSSYYAEPLAGGVR